MARSQPTRRRTIAVFAIFTLALLLLLVIWSLRPARVSIYLIRGVGDHSTLEAVTRHTQGRTTAARLRAAMNALLAGPTDAERAAGLLTAIPPGTRLRGVEIRGRVAYVDLSGDVESGGGSSSMLGRLWQIVYTATQFPRVRQVRILIDGQERGALGGEGVLIDRPLARPAEPPTF